MKCPFCQNDMQPGEIIADPRGGMYFEPEGKKLTFVDKLAGSGRITAAQGGWSKLRISADYCEKCKKMIFDTEITR